MLRELRLHLLVFFFFLSDLRWMSYRKVRDVSKYRNPIHQSVDMLIFDMSKYRNELRCIKVSNYRTTIHQMFELVLRRTSTYRIERGLISIPSHPRTFYADTERSFFDVSNIEIVVQ